MRYLGLDLGTKTLGLAVSDETACIASSIKTIRYEEEATLMEELENIIQEYKIKALVLGLPKNMNNTIGPRAEETMNFQKKLEEQFVIPVYLQDERLSTVSAHQAMIASNMSRAKRKKKVDSVAATIILQTFLDKKGKEL